MDELMRDLEPDVKHHLRMQRYLGTDIIDYYVELIDKNGQHIKWISKSDHGLKHNALKQFLRILRKQVKLGKISAWCITAEEFDDDTGEQSEIYPIAQSKNWRDNGQE